MSDDPDNVTPLHGEIVNVFDDLLDRPQSGRLSHDQVMQLLKPIAPVRVLADGKGHSHVSQQDVTAHLIRVFGFGNFDTEVLMSEIIFETPRVDDKGVPTGRWDVCYRSLVRLTIRDADGLTVCAYEDGATATAENQRSRGDAHDLAMKSAISLAKKRCAVYLGDQFGLSLYNGGQLAPLVRGTLVAPEAPDDTEGTDVQDGVPQTVSLGHDDEGSTRTETEPGKPAVDPREAKVDDILARIAAAEDVETLRLLWTEASKAKILDVRVDDSSIAGLIGAAQKAFTVEGETP